MTIPSSIPAFLVNDYLDNSQSQSDVTVLADGRILVTWQSYAQATINGEPAADFFGTPVALKDDAIIGRIFNADGTPSAQGEFLINTYDTGGQRNPTVTALKDGGFVVTWHSWYEDRSSFAVAAQIFDKDGDTVGDEFRVNTHTSGAQQFSGVIERKDGLLVFAYESAKDASGQGIYLQVMDKSGAKIGPETMVNTTSVGEQTEPVIKLLANGQYIVAWQSDDQDGDGQGVYAQMFKRDGTPVRSEFKLNTTTALDQFDMDITALANGGFAVSYNSTLPGSPGPQPHTLVQVYNKLGNPVGPERDISSNIQYSQQFNSTIEATPDGGFVVAWVSGVTSSGFDIYIRRYDARSQPVGPEVKVSDTGSAVTDREPALSVLEDGSVIVTWTSRDVLNGNDIMMQIYDAQTFGTNRDDRIVDQLGTDWIDGRRGDDLIFGGGGNDDIRGGGGNDVIKGGNGRDRLAGNAGNDVLDGGKGKDVSKGGAGADIFVFKDGYGKDRITDFTDDVDALRLDEDLWGGNLTKAQVIAQHATVVNGATVLTFGTDTLTLKGVSDSSTLIDDIVFI